MQSPHEITSRPKEFITASSNKVEMSISSYQVERAIHDYLKGLYLSFDELDLQRRDDGGYNIRFIR